MPRNGEDAAMRKTLRSGATETVRRRLPEASAGSVRAESPPTATGLEAELAELERLSLDDLRLRWRNNWGRLAPAHLSRGLLFRVMAYRLQAEAFGDLDRKAVGLLERMTNGAAEKLTANGSGTLGSDVESKISSARAAYEPLILKPGALLIREWQGRLERVTVADHGFAWNGATYASLSAAAFAITGTKWNGHRFFGVRRRDNVPVGEHKDDAKGIEGCERPSILARGKPINRPLAECDRSSSLVNATTDAGESDQ
jgi:Protein of unknown function (DUF2924)